MSQTRSLSVIKVHRRKLAEAKDFKAFKAAQIAFVDWLILDMEFEQERDNNAIEFIEGGAGMQWEVVIEAKEEDAKSS